MTLARFEVDETPHNMDGLLLHAWDEFERVEAFISRRVMDRWIDGVSSSAARDCPQSTKRDRRAPWSEHGLLRQFSRSWLECRPAPWLRS